MTQIKALTVLQTAELVLQKFGADEVERIKAALSPEARQCIYESHLVPSDWVDIRYAAENLVVFDELVGRGDGSAACELVRELAAEQFKGVYRLLFAFASPRMMVEKSGRLWNRYYDQGRPLNEMHGDNHATMKILGCPDMPLHHEWMILPFTEEIMRRVGAKDVVAEHSQCVAKGADCCITEVRWK